MNTTENPAPAPAACFLNLVKFEHWNGDHRFELRCDCGWTGRVSLTEKAARNTAKNHRRPRA